MPLNFRACSVGVLAVSCAFLACKARNLTGELKPPKDAQPFASEHRRAFDDDFTAESIELQGRAPNDVLDQRLFTARLGHSDVVALCDVNEVWEKGRYQGRQEQFVDLSIDEILIGSLPRGTEEQQMFTIKGEGTLPSSLQGSRVVLFLKWAPGEIPPYHHHLMPAQESAISYIAALVKMAKDDGVLNDDGKVRRQPRRTKKSRKANKKKEKKSETPALNVKDEEPPS